jgi:hypothetical protein
MLLVAQHSFASIHTLEYSFLLAVDEYSWSFGLPPEAGAAGAGAGAAGGGEAILGLIADLAYSFSFLCVAGAYSLSCQSHARQCSEQRSALRLSRLLLLRRGGVRILVVV